MTEFYFNGMDLAPYLQSVHFTQSKTHWLEIKLAVALLLPPPYLDLEMYFLEPSNTLYLRNEYRFLYKRLVFSGKKIAPAVSVFSFMRQGHEVVIYSYRGKV